MSNETLAGETAETVRVCDADGRGCNVTLYDSLWLTMYASLSLPIPGPRDELNLTTISVTVGQLRLAPYNLV